MMLTLTVVRTLPFVNGILSQDLSPFLLFNIYFPTYFTQLLTAPLYFIITIRYYSLEGSVGMLKKQPYSAHFVYIIYIDVINNVMHNTHLTIANYTHINLFIFCINLRHMLGHGQNLRKNSS